MRLRRCSVLLLEPRETIAFDLESLLHGGSGLGATQRWFALAPHLAAAVEIDAAQRELLGAVGAAQWQPRAALEAAHPADAIDTLLQQGLLIADGPDHAAMRGRDERIRGLHWQPINAVAHYFNRWSGIDAEASVADAPALSPEDRKAHLGPPPPPYRRAAGSAPLQPLARPAPLAWEQALARRATCRNFDPTHELDAAVFARVMHTVFAVQAEVELAPASFALKKTSPSGGGLHPTEAWLLVQRVQGIAPGLYHYHPGEHALQPVPYAPGSAAAPWTSLATRFVAGQAWFAEAPVLVVLAPRFLRSFWKYREHAKAYRALVLDAGHLSQTLYLSATECGLGAFVTSAINEVEIEQAFGMDPLEEGALAVCGFGKRSAQRTMVEFDPLHAVWPG